MSAARTGLDALRDGSASFAVGLAPPDALGLPLADVIEALAGRYGEGIRVALSDEAVDLERPLSELPAAVRSPRAAETDTGWMRRTNMVGINIRTVDDIGGVIRYVATLPAAYDSIHLLPMWEPGAVASLYGISSWNLETAHFSDELYRHSPNLGSIERQFRALSNLVHAMGRTIGMDVIPHTDRYAEPALANPWLYEWMRVEGGEIVEHGDRVEAQAADAIADWLAAAGPAGAGADEPADADELFALDEGARLELLFGRRDDRFGRIARRTDLVKHLNGLGLGPVPATMGVPFRDIVVDPDPAHTVVDDFGMEWHDFVFREPQSMSRVFSPLARFRLHESVDDDTGWQIDFDRPRHATWKYVCERYAEAQHIGNFDFMRGDMSHVQMRPDGVPAEVDEHYDILGAVKTHIQRTADAPWFGYFAESFLPPRDVFGYGEELDHLEAALADATLGDLQSTVVGSAEYLTRFRRYLDDLATRRTAPAFTVMTSDKDDPRFDGFYRAGNEVRTFTSLFVTDMPSYTGLGFEIRDVHDEPVENERYTKLFVFHERGESNVYPSKARHGDHYVWGSNTELFDRLTELRRFAEAILPGIEGATTDWLIPPDATAERGTAAWTQLPASLPAGGVRIVFAANYDLVAASGWFGVPRLPDDVTLVPIHSTHRSGPLGPDIAHNGYFHRIEDLAPGEGRAYRLEPLSP